MPLGGVIPIGQPASCKGQTRLTACVVRRLSSSLRQCLIMDAISGSGVGGLIHCRGRRFRGCGETPVDSGWPVGVGHGPWLARCGRVPSDRTVQECCGYFSVLNCDAPESRSSRSDQYRSWRYRGHPLADEPQRTFDAAGIRLSLVRRPAKPPGASRNSAPLSACFTAAATPSVLSPLGSQENAGAGPLKGCSPFSAGPCCWGPDHQCPQPPAHHCVVGLPPFAETAHEKRTKTRCCA